MDLIYVGILLFKNNKQLLVMGDMKPLDSFIPGFRLQLINHFTEILSARERWVLFGGKGSRTSYSPLMGGGWEIMDKTKQLPLVDVYSYKLK